MKNQSKFILLSAALAVFTLPVVAQSTDASANGQVTGQTIQERKDNQQDRIANGVMTGQLTAAETSNLEKKESELNHEENDMRKQDDGRLTSADKAALTQQQNQLSKDIYQDKHNSATQNTGKDPVDERAQSQQERIAHGIKSGQLTAGEAAHLENNEAKINNEVKNDRAANGGKLTAQEKAQVNRQQNRESHQIYNARHNGRVR
jgi:hypothetical protein